MRAFSAIGKTVESAQRLHGEPFDAQGRVAVYQIGGIDLVATYDDGRTVGEIYSHRDGSLFAENEVSELLAVNGRAGALWRFTDAGSVLCWEFTERTVRIVYKPFAEPPVVHVQDTRFNLRSPIWRE